MAHDEQRFDDLAEVPQTAYRRRDVIASAQVWLPLVALLGLGAFFGVEYLRRGEQRYLPGELAHVHASWEASCAACHMTSEPLAANNWAAVLAGKAHVADAQCQACHRGPAHHSNEKPGDAEGCTSCHREHRGRGAQLTHVADDRCVRCHEDLGAHVRDVPWKAVTRVTRFDTDHPWFPHEAPRGEEARLRDPGTITFNHHLHMRPGLGIVAESRAAMKVRDLPAAFRDRYRQPGQADDELVQLDCASCHRADGRDFQAAELTARGSGEYMQPINYEVHCQACHPLTFEAVKAPDGATRELSVRHRLQPDEIREFLKGLYTDRAVRETPALLDRPVRPLPGKNPQRDEELRRVGDLVAKQVSAAERILFGSGTCGKCHASAQDGKIAPAAIPQVWFKKARFDHTAHRAVSCKECHPGAYPDETATTTDVAVRAANERRPVVLLPGIATCRNCHAPSAGSGATATGGARFDCAECHRYHAVEQGLHGAGAESRGAAGGMLDLGHFLNRGGR